MDDFSLQFQAISDNKRQQILAYLDEKPRCVGELVDLFELSQSSISKHLAVLKNAGFVDSARQGQNVIYSLNSEALSRCCREFFTNFQCCGKLFAKKMGETGKIKMTKA